MEAGAELEQRPDRSADLEPPLDGAKMPAIRRRSVVLPEPFRPMKPIDAPRLDLEGHVLSAPRSRRLARLGRRIASFSVRFRCGLTRKRLLDVLGDDLARLHGFEGTETVSRTARPTRARRRDRRSASGCGRTRARAPPSARALPRRGPRGSRDDPRRSRSGTRAHARRLWPSARRARRGCPARATARRSGSRSGTRRTSERPARSATSCDVSSSWSLVRIAFGEDPLGQAVRREDDVRVGSAHAVGEEREIRLVGVPALDEAKLRAVAEGRFEPLRGTPRSRAASSAARGRAPRSCPPRRRAPGRRPPRSGAASASCRRRREARARVRARRAAPRSRRRAASGRRSAGSARSALRPPRRDRPPRADVLQVRTDVLRLGGAPVGHEDDRGLHAATVAVRSWTSSTRRPRSAGSVSGRTPWPRLKM